MRNDDSSAFPALAVEVQLPSPDRLQSLLRDAQMRALNLGSNGESADEHFDWNAPPPELVESLAGFKIVDTIDEGGQGIVYKARYIDTSQLVAVKVLRNGRLSSQSDRRRFEREIQTLAKLNHPNIVKFIPHHSQCAYRYFCMEFIEGEPIDEFVFQRRLSVREVVELVIKVCDALQSAHRALILHRDMKPGNVLVTSDGEPHILDFGLSRNLDAEMRGLHSRISKADERVGTLVYSAPEQVDDRFGDVDTRTDVYALGLVLYELLVGCKPYPTHGTAREVGESIATAKPKSLRKIVATTKTDDRWTSGVISDDLEQIVLKTLEKEQSRRYESVESLKKDLLRFLAGQTVEAKPASYLYSLRRFVSRHRWGVGLTAALLAVIFGSAIAMLAMWQHSVNLAKSALNASMLNTMIRNGQALKWANGPTQAIPAYQSVLELARSADANDPVVQSSMFEASQALASMLFDQRDLEKGLPYLETAELIADNAIQANPSDIGAIRQMALVHISQSKRFQAEAARYMKPRIESKYSEALRLCRESAKASVELRRQILQLGKQDEQRHELAIALDFLGTTLWKHKRTDEGLAQLQEALDIVEALHLKDPDNVEYRLTLAFIEHNIAGAHIRYDTPEQDQLGLAWLEKSEKRLDELQASRKANYHGSDMWNVRNGIDGNRKLVAKHAMKRAKKKIEIQSTTSMPASSSP